MQAAEKDALQRELMELRAEVRPAVVCVCVPWFGLRSVFGAGEYIFVVEVECVWRGSVVQREMCVC